MKEFHQELLQNRANGNVLLLKINKGFLMIKLLSLLLLSNFLTVHSHETITEFKCTEAGATYLSQFKMEGSIRTWKNPNHQHVQNLWGIDGLKAKNKEAGHNTSFRVISFGIMEGKMKMINDPSWTLEPFTVINLTPSKENTTTSVAAAQLNLDYPGKLSSQIRLKNGKTFKAKCETTAQKICLFDEDIYHDENIFQVVELEDLYIESRMWANEPDYMPGQTILVEKTLLIHRSTGKIFFQFTTFEDEWDGGNTMGWIEDAFGNHVANIGDGEIYDCSAF